MKNLSLSGFCALCVLAVAACSPPPVTTDAATDAARDVRDGAVGDAADVAVDVPADRASDAADARVDTGTDAGVDAIDARADTVTPDVRDVLATDTVDVSRADVVDVTTADIFDASSADVMDVVGLDATDASTADASTGVDVIAVDRIVVPATGLVINEVDYDQIGTDTAEFIEIYNGGTAAVPLTNLALVFIGGAASGGGGTAYTTFGLAPGVMLLPGQYLVVATATVTIPSTAVALRFAIASDNIQNGPHDAVALIETSSSTLVDALSYEGAVTAATIAGFTAAVNLVEGTVLPTAVADSNTVIGSLSRTPNGNDSNDAANDWAFTTTPTPGEQ
ncbi:MAG: lamin tail domain-containing protein, partial [Deltaproteobacteria bacterium]